MRFKLMAAMAATAALGACATTAVDPGFGEALRYDMAAQTINPDPIYPPGAAQPGSLATVGAAAAERYRKGAVKPVQTIGTTSSGSAGAGGGPQ